MMMIRMMIFSRGCPVQGVQSVSEETMFIKDSIPVFGPVLQQDLTPIQSLERRICHKFCRQFNLHPLSLTSFKLNCHWIIQECLGWRIRRREVKREGKKIKLLKRLAGGDERRENVFFTSGGTFFSSINSK